MVGQSVIISTQLKDVSTVGSGISYHRKEGHLINVRQSVVLKVHAKLIFVPRAVLCGGEWMAWKVVEEEKDSDANRLTPITDYGSPLPTVVPALVSQAKRTDRGLPPQQNLIPLKFEVAPVSDNWVHPSNVEGQRREPATGDVRIATRRAGWCLFAGPSGWPPNEVDLAAKSAEDARTEPPPHR
jgi:hypothetical protein